jgi:hypothetical protein
MWKSVDYEYQQLETQFQDHSYYPEGMYVWWVNTAMCGNQLEPPITKRYFKGFSQRLLDLTMCLGNGMQCLET